MGALAGFFPILSKNRAGGPYMVSAKRVLTRTLFIKGAPQCRVGRGRVDNFSTSQGSGLRETVSEDSLGGGSVEKSVMEGEVLSVPWEISRTEGDGACL